MTEIKNTNKKEERKDLLPILMVNSFLWVVAIVADLILHYNSMRGAGMYTVLAGGAVVSIVAVSMAWKNRRHSLR